MLREIHIKNFAIIDNLDLELKSGMTVITGETGAGKSIVIDALDIALGDRADSKMIRHGCDKCEITLVFDVSHIEQAKAWLTHQEFFMEENECCIRRVTSKEGRSRSYINGSVVTLQQLKELGELLVHVHGQHEHHALLKREQQRLLLDQYMKEPGALQEVGSLYHEWKALQQEIEFLEQHTGQEEAKTTLLKYQVEELRQFHLTDNEFETLHKEHEQLANGETILKTCEHALHLLDESPEGSVQSLLHHVMAQLHQCKVSCFQPLDTLLNNALIEVTEAISQLKQIHHSVDINHERLHWIDTRLSQLYDMARKHKVKPQELYEHQKTLEKTLEALLHADEKRLAAQKKQQAVFVEYEKAALLLSQKRQQAATTLSECVDAHLSTLGMPHGHFEIAFSKHSTPTPVGMDVIDFMVRTNPGQPLQLLHKIASGGELSRMSLAIQVITAQSQTTPTLVFDEVDVGIGGGTAEIVGQLLKSLGQHAQILCITHLPQVAAQGHEHLKIHKADFENGTVSTLSWLSHEERIQELARMLGGIKITPQTLAHAEEMLTHSLEFAALSADS